MLEKVTISIQRTQQLQFSDFALLPKEASEKKRIRKSRRGQTTPQMSRQFLGISRYFALLKKY